MFWVVGFSKHVNTHTHTPSEIGRKFSVGNCTAVALIALPAHFRDQANWDLKTNKAEWSALGMRFVGAPQCSEGKLAKREQATSAGVARVPARKEPRSHNSCPTQQCWVSHTGIPEGNASQEHCHWKSLVLSCAQTGC